MVIGDNAVGERKPFIFTLGHTFGARNFNDRCAHFSDLLFGEMLAEESEYLAPTIHGLFWPVQRPVPIEEAVTGAVVTMEFVRLAVLLELSFVHIHLFRARRPIIIAEEAKQRTVEVLRHVDRRDGRFVVELFLPHHDPATPKLNTGVNILFLARINEGVPTT